MRVYIIGAGPGDPRLLTLRGAELIASCPVLLYTGSLVPREVLSGARPDAVVRDSSGMTLDEIVELMIRARDADQDVARVHTGDPLLFGSTAEQMRRLDELGIPYEIVPGVSAFTAAAAVLGRELTLPELSQTVILTRAEGRTPMPEGEKLADLARHRATMALFLSITLLDEVTRALIPAYGPECPVAVVHKATCPDQTIVTGTLSDIRAKVKAAGIRTQSMVLIGHILTSTDFAESRLYHPDFSHRFRKAGRGARRPSRRSDSEPRSIARPASQPIARPASQPIARPASQPIARPASQPLHGRRVLLARARPGPSRIAAELRALGAEVIELPDVIALALADQSAGLDASLARPEEFDSLIVACAPAAEAVFARDAAAGLPVIAIGREAASTLIRRGQEPALQIGGSCREALEAHAAALVGRRLLLVTSDAGRPNLAGDLAALGASVRTATAYRTVHRMPASELPPVDLVLLPSSSAARAVLSSEHGPALCRMPILVMGPRTEAEAERWGARRVLRATHDTTAALVSRALAELSETEVA